MYRSLRRLAAGVRRWLRAILSNPFRDERRHPGRASTQESTPSTPARPTAPLKRDISKAYPRESKQNLYDAVDFLRGAEVDRRNQQVVSRIRGRGRSGSPLRVTFLANDRAKWNATPLVEEMRRRGWDVGIALALTDARDLDRAGRQESYQREREYFTELDAYLHTLYDPDADRAVPVETLDTDVVFYQQPWGMRDFPRRMVGRSLAAYMHYGFVIMANHGMHYNIGTFHSYLWRYFTQTEEHRLMHLAHDPSAADRLVVTGYPKLDVYVDIDPTERVDHHLWASTSGAAKRMIFAPHHSLGQDNLRMSTFRWTGRAMLDLAREHQDIQWVYKPHPTLKYSVVKNGVMTRDEYRAYEASWDEQPNAAVYDSGDYFDLFRSSDGLITDCGSFLAEYLPTGNPIIRLVEADSIPLNDVGTALSPAFYEAHDLERLHELFTAVVLRGEDPLAGERVAAATKLFPSGSPTRSSVAVTDHLAEALFEDPDL